MKKESPYEYHNGKLGVKANYLFFDKNKCCHPDSLRLIPYRSLKYRMDSVCSREKQLRQPFQGHPALVEFDSLSIDWQEKLIRTFGSAPELTRKRWLENFYEFDNDAFLYFTTYTEGKERRRLEQSKVMEYTYNASVLNAVIKCFEDRRKFRRMKGGESNNIWETLSFDVNEFNDVPHTLPLSPDGLRKKVALYREKKYEMLIDGRRNNQNAIVMDDATQKLLNSIFAGQQNKPTYTDVFRTFESFLDGYTEVVNKSTGELYDPKDFKKISKSTIMAYLAKWEHKIATFQMRGGDRQRNMEMFKPHHEMERPTFAGSLLSIDDRVPPFEYEKGKRLVCYLGVDVASEFIVASVFGKNKEGIIIDFYKELVRNHHEFGVQMPYELECESSLNSSFKNTFLSDGAMFQKVRIEANNARGKYVERINGMIRYEFERHMEGWIARPFAKLEAYQQGNHEVPIIPYETLVEQLMIVIENFNNSPCSQNPSKTRFEYFMEMQNPKLTPTNWMAILPEIGRAEKSSCNAGYVILQGRKRMIADNGQILFGEELIAKLKKIEGKTLEIYWLENHDGGVQKAIAFLKGEFVCELLPIPRYNRAKVEQTDADLANREIQSKYTMSVEAFARTQKQQIDKVLVIENQEKTLNRKFVMPGLNRFTKREQPVETMPDYDDDADLVLINNPRPSATSWRNNF